MFNGSFFLLEDVFISKDFFNKVKDKLEFLGFVLKLNLVLEWMLM